jgi:transcription initiation factor TFIIIB Brf1 subunit/transcription initiation factor TFIIB
VIQHNCYDAIVYPEGLSGERICSICGLVIDDPPTTKNFIQWSPEWQSNWSEKDSETLKEWLNILRSVSCQLNIPRFPYREEAARRIRKQNYQFTRSQKLSKNKRAAVAALMHIILREYNKARPLKEICKELTIDPTSVIKQEWILIQTLNNGKETVTLRRKSSVDYLHEALSKLNANFNSEFINRTEEIITKVKKSGGNPVGIAAGALYYTCKKSKRPFCKEKIGEAFHISARTVYTNEARIRRLLVTKPPAKLDNNRFKLTKNS